MEPGATVTPNKKKPNRIIVDEYDQLRSVRKEEQSLCGLCGQEIPSRLIASHRNVCQAAQRNEYCLEHMPTSKSKVQRSQRSQHSVGSNNHNSIKKIHKSVCRGSASKSKSNAIGQGPGLSVYQSRQNHSHLSTSKNWGKVYPQAQVVKGRMMQEPCLHKDLQGSIHLHRKKRSQSKNAPSSLRKCKQQGSGKDMQGYLAKRKESLNKESNMRKEKKDRSCAGDYLEIRQQRQENDKQRQSKAQERQSRAQKEKREEQESKLKAILKERQKLDEEQERIMRHMQDSRSEQRKRQGKSRVQREEEGHRGQQRNMKQERQRGQQRHREQEGHRERERVRLLELQQQTRNPPLRRKRSNRDRHRHRHPQRPSGTAQAHPHTNQFNMSNQMPRNSQQRRPRVRRRRQDLNQCTSSEESLSEEFEGVPVSRPHQALNFISQTLNEQFEMMKQQFDHMNQIFSNFVPFESNGFVYFDRSHGDSEEEEEEEDDEEQEEEEEEEEEEKGLREEQISMLPQHRYQKKLGHDDQCTVCLSSIKQREVVRRMPCQHFFHSECIDEWLARKSQCPVCREDIGPALR